MDVDVKPWWPVTESLEKELSSFKALLANPPAYGAGEKLVVQPYISTVLQSLGPLERSLRIQHRLVDGHGAYSYLNRKPDIVGYHHQASINSPFAITFVGDVKGTRAAKTDRFTAEEIGQVIGFCEDLFQVQPSRPEVTAFLIDGRIVQFFRLRREKGFTIAAPALQLDCTVVYDLSSSDGVHVLLSFLQTAAEKLHAPYRPIVIKTENVQLNKYLGHGHSAVVYSGTFREGNVVVKLFHDKQALEHERKQLKKAAATLGSLVPKLLAHSDRALILHPEGVQFASTLRALLEPNARLPELADFIQLLGIIRRVGSELRMAHRDLSLTNFFRHKDDAKVVHVFLQLLCHG
jgi:hypothetical protein